MKKFTKLACALCAALLLATGCTQSAPKEEAKATAAPTNQLEAIKAKGVLVVATSPDYPPMEFLDKDNKPIGSDMALAQYIADGLGVKLEILNVDFSTTMLSVETGKADMAISGLGWKKDREEQYELSIGYNKGAGSESSCQGLIVHTKDVEKYKSLDDFAGLKIAAQANSLQEGFAKEQIKNADIQIVTDIGSGIMLMQSGKADAMALSCDIAKGYANTVEGITKSSVEFVIDDLDKQAGNVVAVKKGEKELIAEVNKMIEVINEKKLFEEWHAEAKKQAKELGINFEE